MFILLLSLLPLSTLTSICTSKYCQWSIEPPWESVDEGFVPSVIYLQPRRLATGHQFLWAQGRYGGAEQGNLTSPLLDKFQGNRLLSFKYSKTTGNAKLEIFLKEGLNLRRLDVIDSNSAIQWDERTTIVPETKQIHQIVFQISQIKDGFDALALDKIELKASNKGPIHTNGGGNVDYFSNTIRDKDIRRAPPNTLNSPFNSVCNALRCQFSSSFCMWKTKNFVIENGFSTSTPNNYGRMESEFVMVPINAHFEIHIFAKNASILSIFQKSGIEETLLWSQGGIALPGWNTFRIPFRSSPLPSSIILKSSGSISISQTNLVDELGRNLACGSSIAPIRPERAETVRLTAIQKISDKETLPIIVSTTLPPLPPIPLSIPSEIEQNEAVTPISPAFISSGSTKSSKRASLPIATSELPPTLKILQNMDLDHLQKLAKQFGLGDLNGPAVQRLLALAEKKKLPKPPPGAISPIQPKEVHVLNTKNSLQTQLLNLQKLPPSIQDMLTSNLSKILELSKQKDADSRPFSRLNMDYVVQNAFNAYMAQARP